MSGAGVANHGPVPSVVIHSRPETPRHPFRP